MFLTLEQVHRLHSIGLEDHGGSPGIRDLGLIESALAWARNERILGKAGTKSILTHKESNL